MKLLLILFSILQSLFATLEQKTFVSNFSISIVDPQMQSMSYDGDLKMKGKQFAINMYSMEAAYDGNTLYIYSEDIDELSLSSPTEDELIQTNPFLYAQTLLPKCQYSEKQVGDDTEVTIVPNDKSVGVQKFVMSLTATQLPARVEVYENNGAITTLSFQNAHFTDETPSFIIQKEGAYINDLR